MSGLSPGGRDVAWMTEDARATTDLDVIREGVRGGACGAGYLDLPRVTGFRGSDDEGILPREYALGDLVFCASTTDRRHIA